MAISVQIRRKVYTALDRGESINSIAGRFEIGRRTVMRLKNRRKDGLGIEPLKPGPKGHVKLTDADLALIASHLESNPDALLRELQAMMSVHVAESTIWRAVQKLGYTLKKSH